MTTDSPFSAHLGTNYCPKDEEVLEIKSLLVEPTLRLKSLDNEIADLQKAIDKLKEEHDSVGSFVEAHKALISLARRLPLDIIQEIFVACLPNDRNCAMSASEAPVLLGRICSSWRAISMSTPRIWAKLHIVDPPPFPDAPTLVAETVALRLATAKIWLRRSGQCPLSISLKCGFEYYPGPSSITRTSVLQLLIQFAPRWQHIHFTIPPAALQEILDLTETDVPLLETVALKMTDPHGVFTWGSFGILRAARLSSFSMPWNAFHLLELLPLRWHQLTTLSIDGLGWGVWSGLMTEASLRAISSCPELRCCKLTVSDLTTEPQSQHPIVELAFLHTLEVHCTANLTIPYFFQRLSVPALRKFILRGLADSDQCSDRSLAHFIGTLSHLEDFDIEHNIFSKAALLETLQSLPSTVKRLVISDGADMSFNGSSPISLDDDTLALLTPADDAIPALCCPALRTLLIKDGRLISDSALLRFISTRMKGDTPLRRVHAQFKRGRTLDLNIHLTPFMDNGLEVSIVHSLFRTPWSILGSLSPWNGLTEEPYNPEPSVVGFPIHSTFHW
ncbi:hypothetical protein C8F04DRAFT_351278 [Mycena alexandri]|uniref:F-box domain-containing protein n=1 Tax=Mycena alexandri TaxID=1745969 RepID=A0AAD6S1E0_9AGAR|nr:hypothetical protein C8F04DRAFT_351278 [Mycena alexandri]